MNSVIAERERLEEALTLISAQRARFGDATVDTAVAVLEEQLANLPSPAGKRAAETHFPRDQRKQVTILFASIDGFTQLKGSARNTDRLREIDLLWRRIDEMIHDHGGVVDKHMGDVIMGIFGATVSREDDPERAVRCAMVIREMVGEYLTSASNAPKGISGATEMPVFRAGINTGQVLLGQVGSDTGRTAIGDAVNVASRLKEARANSGIYISQETYRLVRHQFRFESLGEITVKGRKTPVEVFQVVGTRPRLFFPGEEGVARIHAPMIGREKELSILKAALSNSAEKRRGRLVLVVGDAGVGKSRLAGEFYRRLESSPVGVTIFQARSDERMAQVSYSLLRELLIAHFDIKENDRPEAIEDKIATQLVETLSVNQLNSVKAAKHARSILNLIGMPAPNKRQLERDETNNAAGRERAISIALEYLAAVARRSTVSLFLLEDIHWIDEDSLGFLERLLTTAADTSLLMVGMARPVFFSRRPNWPGKHAVAADHLTLQPLPESKCRELVLSILRKLPYVPPELSDLIIQSAGGNPFYVEEFIQGLIEDGVIVPHEKNWLLRPRDLTRLRVPATLRGVLQARLDRLPEVERVILQQAAVVGDVFWAGAVKEINAASRLPYSEEQVEAALQSLEQRDIIHRTSAPAAAGRQTYLFKHAMLREVAYEGVLLRDRPGYHLQAAHWLETWSSDRLADYAGLIAQHLEHGGRPAEAARLYEMAAVRAYDQYKIPGAIHYYQKVLELLRDMPQHLDTRLAVMERLGNALHQQCRLVEALENYREMHNLAELDGNIIGRARALNGQAIIFHELGNDNRSLEAATEASQLARLTGAEMEWLRATLLQGEAAARLGRTHEAMAAATLAVERARALDAPLEALRGLVLLTLLPSAVAQPQVARDAMAELVALVDESINDGDGHNQKRVASTVLTHIGDLILAQGRAAESVDHFSRALELARGGGDLTAVAEILRRLGLAKCRMGDGPGAFAHLEEAAALAETTGNRYLRLFCRLTMGEALLALGHQSAAEATLRQVIAAAEDRQRLGSWKELSHAYRLLDEVVNNKKPGAFYAPGY